MRCVNVPYYIPTVALRAEPEVLVRGSILAELVYGFVFNFCIFFLSLVPNVSCECCGTRKHTGESKFFQLIK